MGKGAKEPPCNRYEVLDASPEAVSNRERRRQERAAAAAVLEQQQAAAAGLQSPQLPNTRPRTTAKPRPPPEAAAQDEPAQPQPAQHAQRAQHAQQYQDFDGYILRPLGDANSSDDEDYIFPPARKASCSRQANGSHCSALELPVDCLDLPDDVVAEQQRLWQQLTAQRTPAAARDGQRAGPSAAAAYDHSAPPAAADDSTVGMANAWAGTPCKPPAAVYTAQSPATRGASSYGGLGGALGALMRSHDAKQTQQPAQPAAQPSQSAANGDVGNRSGCTTAQPLLPVTVDVTSRPSKYTSSHTHLPPTRSSSTSSSSADFPPTLVEEQQRMWAAFNHTIQQPGTPSGSCHSQPQLTTGNGISRSPQPARTQTQPAASNTNSSAEAFPSSLVEEQQRIWAALEKQRRNPAAAEAAIAAAAAAAEAAAIAAAAAAEAGFDLPLQLSGGMEEQQRLWIEFAQSMGASFDNAAAAATVAAAPESGSWASVCHNSYIGCGISDCGPSSSSTSSSPLASTLGALPPPALCEFPALPSPSASTQHNGSNGHTPPRRLRPNSLPAHWQVSVRRANSNSGIRVVRAANIAATNGSSSGAADDVLQLRPGREDLHWDLRMEGLQLSSSQAEADDVAGGHPSDAVLKERTLLAAEAHAASEQQRRVLNGALVNGTSKEALTSMMAKAGARAASAGAGAADSAGARPGADGVIVSSMGNVSFQGINEWRRLVAAMMQAGWEPLSGRSGGHSKFRRTLPISGVVQVVTFASSPSDSMRGIKNTAADLQRQERKAAEIEREAAVALQEQRRLQRQ